MLALALALCIPMIHKPLIRRMLTREHGELGAEMVVGAVVGDQHGEDQGDSVVYISKAFMLIGCLFLASLRVAIPLLIFWLGPREPGGFRPIRL